MKRSEILQILARRLSNRDVEDIQEAAILEMKFVQETVLEKLPVQPWFLQTEIILPLAQADKFVELPADYNSLDTTGGVWIAPAILAPACQTVVPTMPAIPNQRLSMVTNGDAVSRPIGDSVEPFFDTSVPDDSSLVCLAE
jgi:hypothetical protein